MLSAGIDIGSRTVKMVAVEDGVVITTRKADNSFDPVAVGTTLLEGVHYDRLTATGYGRHIFRVREARGLRPSHPEEDIREDQENPCIRAAARDWPNAG